MFKGTSFITIIMFLFFSTISAMKTEMIEIIKDNQKILIPLTEIAKKIKPLVPAKESINVSTAFLESTFQFITSYPKEIAQFVGYASLFGSILWFAKSKHCIITPSSFQRLQNEEATALCLIEKEEAELMSDIDDNTTTFVINTIEKNLGQAKMLNTQTTQLSRTLQQKYEIWIEEEKSNNQNLFQEYHNHLETIKQHFAQTQSKQVEYLKQKNEETQNSINNSFSEYHRFCDKRRENTAQLFNDIQNKLDNSQHTNKKVTLFLDDLQDEIFSVEKSAKILGRLNEQVERADDLSIEELSSLLSSLEAQKKVLNDIEANLTRNSEITIRFLPTQKN